MSVSLSPRLEAVLSLIKPQEVVFDVGSDHAKLPIALFERGISSRVYAVENKKGPYGRMLRAIEASGFPVIPIFGDGLDELAGDVDVIVIAGMGERLIKELLERGRFASRKGLSGLLIDAHGETAYLRGFLAQGGWHLARNVPLIDGDVYYDVERWEPGPSKKPYDEKSLRFGPLNVLDPAPPFLFEMRHRLKGIASLLENPSIGTKMREELARERELLEEIVHERP